MNDTLKKLYQSLIDTADLRENELETAYSRCIFVKFRDSYLQACSEEKTEKAIDDLLDLCGNAQETAFAAGFRTAIRLIVG